MARPAGIAPAPDGGYGWVVCLAACMLQLLTLGVTYTFGVLLSPLMEEFGEKEDIVTWAGSIQAALLYLTGIFAGPLIPVLGWRMICIAGALLSASGLLISSWAPNIYILYLTYGVITGLGNGAMYLVSMTSIQFYFERRRALATGIAVSGSGLGFIIFGYLTSTLITTFQWRNTLRIEAGIMLIAVIFGALIKPLDVVKTNEIDIEHSEQINTSDCNDQRCNACRTCMAVVGSIFDFSLFKNPVFVLFCLSFSFFCFGYHIPFTYVPELARSRLDLTLPRASFLVSVIGIANVGSRLTFGFIADRGAAMRFYLGVTCLFISGTMSCLINFFNSYTLFVVYSSIFGICSGCWASLFTVILVDLLGVGIIVKALSQTLAVGSIAFLIASPVSGVLIHQTGVESSPFLLAGGAQILGGICIVNIKWFKTDTEIEDVEYLIECERSLVFTQSFS